jgi:phosphopantothenoylcysteine decarboxylase/phosphopantothenate--cysteine ligase
MGIAIAEEALARGAKVTIVYGKGTAKPPETATVINVETTEEMSKAVSSELKKRKYDILIAAAACADYKPIKKEAEKIPSKQKSLTLLLEPTVKVIEEARKADKNIFLCGFKAETKVSPEILIERTSARLKDVGANLMVANDISNPGSGFMVDTNEVYIVDAKGHVTHVQMSSKREVAAKIIETIIAKLYKP